ncbi:hypothetical protein TNCT_198401 [Trichonephila clavata]|uniref:Uncharacterized protein n=1 Tax=Trichonephila clavata TaxID=2740835 RepID=A0A8X6G591_TRICU|nr:hypothetical protein TNCT_198401 [Trichonephila clavata]
MECFQLIPIHNPIALKQEISRKHLLSTGSKVMSDVVSGSSLKDSARSRFREHQKDKDDIMHKIQSGSGIKKEIHKKSFACVKRNRKREKKQTILVVIWIPERVHA